MNPTILIYNDRESKTCTGELSKALDRDFKNKHVSIVETDRHHLVRNITELSPSIIILPEIKGEESFYNRHIPLKARKVIKSHVANGAMVVTQCAASYWIAQKIFYSPGQGERKFRSGQNVFNGVAMNSFGPVKGYWRPSNGKEDLGGCHIIPLIVKTKDGWQADKCWYGNGPAFYAPEGKTPPEVEVLARYSGADDAPIAALHARFGKGSFLVSGPLSHYHHGGVNANNLLWRVVSHRMHKQLFEIDARPVLKAVP